MRIAYGSRKEIVVTSIGAFDGAEICELVGYVLLYNKIVDPIATDYIVTMA